MDARLISEETPTSVYTGRVWIKPSTATAYIRLGSTWIVLASAGDPIDMERITVLINGQDKTSIVGKTEPLNIIDILTKEVDTCTLSIIDTAGGNKPTIGQEVLIFYRQTTTSTPILIFGGRIDEIPQQRLTIGKYTYTITCTDFTQDLNRRQVVEVYQAQTAGDIIKDFIPTYAPTLGTFHVQDGPTIDYISFNYRYPFDCLTELAELTGYDWYVDYEKNIHFFSEETNSAPYDLTETSASGDYKDLIFTIMKQDLRNAITVRGGYEFSALYTQIREADGEQTSFNIDYEPFTPITVEIDTGGGYVLKTLGIDNIDTSGTDFVVNVSEKVIKNSDLATLSAGDKIRIKYKYKKPILAYVEDEDSIALMKQYEGGDGVYEAPLVVDDTIETKDQARTRGLAEINQYSNPLIEGTFMTTQYGYKSGQRLLINIPTRGINAYYMIRQVSATSLGNGNFVYEVTVATTLKGFTEFLLFLYENGKKVFERTDEILDRLKIAPSETVTLAHTVAAESRRNTTTDPYKWSNDAGTTSGKGQWNKASWG